MKDMTEHNHCMYFVKRKSRFCRMTVQKGKEFCGEHQERVSGTVSDERIKCPLDPAHTCYQSKLERHLSVCNAKRISDAKPTFIVKGINLDTNKVIVAPHRVPLSQLDEDVVKAIIRKINLAYEKLPEFAQTVLEHDVLKRPLNDTSFGKQAKKHLLQNASLLGHLERANLVKSDTCFIEFGAGRAQLTYWLGQIIKDKSNSCILVVDRSSHRHKNDNKLKNEQNTLIVKRVRTDIADLQLNQIADIQAVKYKVGIAKHLCGTATDLALRCLVNSMHDDPKVNVRGLIIALCCHHKCEYTAYVGKEYLQQCGFTANEFSILCSIASWATCGARLKDNSKSHDSTIVQDSKFRYVSDEREIVGQKVKTLLNWGRLVFLQNVGFHAEMFHYISPDVSLENMCILATRRHST